MFYASDTPSRHTNEEMYVPNCNVRILWMRSILFYSILLIGDNTYRAVFRKTQLLQKRENSTFSQTVTDKLETGVRGLISNPAISVTETGSELILKHRQEICTSKINVLIHEPGYVCGTVDWGVQSFIKYDQCSPPPPFQSHGDNSHTPRVSLKLDKYIAPAYVAFLTKSPVCTNRSSAGVPAGKGTLRTGSCLLIYVRFSGYR
jgi:hypothetical protein